MCKRKSCRAYYCRHSYIVASEKEQFGRFCNDTRLTSSRGTFVKILTGLVIEVFRVWSREAETEKGV